MASTNFTTHYSIPLPLGTDLTTPMDYNRAAEAVDTALFGAVTDADNASQAANAAVETANTASTAVDTIGSDLALEKAKIVQLQTRMTAAENNIDDVYTDVTDMITAYKEPSATSTHAYAIGDYFIYNETLYKATAAIAIGATIVPNTNCETTNVSAELKQINSDLSYKSANKISYVNDITNVTSFSDAFVAPRDCVLVISTGANVSDYGIVRIYGSDVTSESGSTRITLLACGNGSHGQTETFLLRKGMKAYTVESAGTTVYAYYLSN